MHALDEIHDRQEPGIFRRYSLSTCGKFVKFFCREINYLCSKHCLCLFKAMFSLYAVSIQYLFTEGQKKPYLYITLVEKQKVYA